MERDCTLHTHTKKSLKTTLEILLNGLEDSLSVFCSLQADLLSDDISILPLHAPSCFRLCLDAQELVLVP